MTKTKKPLKVHPFDCIGSWSVVASHNVHLFINAGNTQFSDGASLDVEHDGKGNFVGIGIYEPTTNVCYYWSDFELAKRLSIPKFVAHNGISDLKCLRQWGFKIDGSWLIWDTMLMQHIIDSSQKDYGLKTICKREGIGGWPSYEEIVGKDKTLLDFPIEAVAEYNAADCYYTYKLYQKQLITIPTNNWYFTNVEKPCASIFAAMSDRGIRIDLEYLNELKTYLEDQKAPVEQEIKNELGPINLNSPRQVLEALQQKDIYPEFKGRPSCDKRGSISRMEGIGVIRALMCHSELETLLSSFVYPYLERKTEIVHPRFNQVGTRTGRPSCSNPNLLQIPKRTEYGRLVRRMFIPRKGYIFGDCDYGQIEPRLLGHLSKDETLCSMFNSGTDFHSFTSERLGIDRDKAKILNLSVGYRATFKSVSQQLKSSESEAQKEIDAWWSMFPQLREWQDKLIYNSKKDGYCTTLMGRRIKVEGLGEYNKWKREHAQRRLINNICQASAAEVMKIAMIRVNAEVPHIPLLVQVYDELLFELQESQVDMDLKLVKNAMTNAIKLDVPLVVDGKSGSNWADVC